MSYLLLILVINTALLVGNEFSVAVFIHPALVAASHQQYLAAIQVFAQRFGQVMPIWMGGTAGCHLILTGLSWRSHSAVFPLLLAATVLWLGIIAFSLLGPVPINNQVIQWNLAQLPNDWIALRQRWDRLNLIRVALLLTALTLLLLAFGALI